jgi:hypothetical protein
MSTRVVKIAVVSDFVRIPSPPSAPVSPSPRSQVCTSCFIVNHELAAAIDYCKRMKLPLEFQFKHLPFRLISANCLKPNTTISKVKLYDCLLGEERAANLRRTFKKWGDEKEIPMCVLSLLSLPCRKPGVPDPSPQFF